MVQGALCLVLASAAQCWSAFVCLQGACENNHKYSYTMMITNFYGIKVNNIKRQLQSTTKENETIANIDICCVSQVVIIDEVATLLGCVVGLSPLVIGMSLVALGTSLPDTFCSRTAAVKDDHADAAVGNITGSNAANVFLGLGLPWLISSAYYASKGERFCSDSGALAFSVLVFSCVSVVWLTVLVLRRLYAGGELGAKSAVAKWGLAALAFGLWGLFLVLTGLVSDGGLDDSWIAVRAGACVSSTS